MKKNLKWMFTVTGMLFSYVASAQTNPDNPQEIYAELRTQMERACPIIWEDLGANMDTETLNDDPWSDNQADKGQFIALMQEVVLDATAEDIVSMANDVATVATECASHRVALLDALISKTPRDVLLAMDAVNRGLNKSVEYLDGGWSTGDVRVTGRMVAQDGWVFLTGQTIGSASSQADMRGDEYYELFELAKNWAPNAGNEDWSANGIVTLPDMRGRGLFGADNMGGNSANVLSNANADIIGGAFGSESQVISSEQLPTHNHTMNEAGNHGHTLGHGGNHSHKMTNLRSYVYVNPTGSSSSYKSPWLRSGADLSTRSAGNHTHTVTAAGSHAHTINNAGGSAPLNTVSPGIVFNVEMKY